MMARQIRLSLLISVIGTMMPAWAAEDEGTAPPPPPRADKIKVLIITGGHEFERDPFFAMFKDIPDMTYREVVQPEGLQWFAPAKANEYDVMLWYDLWKTIEPENQKILKALLEKGKPLVSLHHSVANYRNWEETIKIIGAKYYVEPAEGQPKSLFKHGVKMKVKVADSKHPITRFLKDYEIVDETYKQMAFLPDLKPLLTTDNPDSDKAVAWAHKYGQGPVVYIQGGHDHLAYENPSFRRLLLQSIRWAAGRLPDPSEDGFVPLFNGKNLDGWTVMGDPAGFTVKDGMLHSESGKGGLWLRTNETYSDFTLRAEWRISKEGNSGIFIRCEKEGYPWVTGNEIQISNEPRNNQHCTGALYGRVAVDPRPDESPDVWHEFEIQCQGTRIKIFADNIPVIDVDQKAVPAMSNMPLSGYIGLQDSHNPTGWVDYRNVRIKKASK